MLRHSFDREDAATAIEEAVRSAIASGLRTRDIAVGGPSVGTREMAEKIAAAI